MAEWFEIPFLPPPDRSTTRHKTTDGYPYLRHEITHHPAHDLNMSGLIQRYDGFCRTWSKQPACVVMGWDIYESLFVMSHEQTGAMGWPANFMGARIVVVSREGFCEFVHEPQEMFRLRGAQPKR